jgi:hypothetical protein
VSPAATNAAGIIIDTYGGSAPRQHLLRKAASCITAAHDGSGWPTSAATTELVELAPA